MRMDSHRHPPAREAVSDVLDQLGGGPQKAPYRASAKLPPTEMSFTPISVSSATGGVPLLSTSAPSPRLDCCGRHCPPRVAVRKPCRRTGSNALRRTGGATPAGCPGHEEECQRALGEQPARRGQEPATLRVRQAEAPGPTGTTETDTDATRRGITVLRRSRRSAGEMGDLTRRAFAVAAAGRVRVVVGQTCPLERAADAHTAIGERATVGKTLPRVSRPASAATGAW